MSFLSMVMSMYVVLEYTVMITGDFHGGILYMYHVPPLPITSSLGGM